MIPSSESSMDKTFVNKVTQTIHDNLHNEQFSVEELAEQVGISRAQLHRKLKVIEGKSVSQFIREVRLKEAMKMLQNEVATSSEIAYLVGFGSTSYFNSCFNAFYGYPPGEVKKRMMDPLHQDASLDTLSSKDHSDPDAKANLNSSRGQANKSKQYQGVFAVGLFFIIAAVVTLYFYEEQNQLGDIHEKSIAVLPFENLSSDEENQHFADGIVEDLINRLSLIEQFRITSRTSTEMYREKGSKSVPQIARELGVAYIIEGSVQREANTARINIQLIDAKNDVHVWSKLFDREVDEVFKIQSEIAFGIASELNTILTSTQSDDIKKNRTENIKAFELYQLGRFHWNQRTYEGFVTSIDYFEKAIAEDPEYGLAYAGLANTYYLMGLLGHLDEIEGRNKAVELARKAIELDESLTEAHSVLAAVYTYFDFQWDRAEIEHKRSIQLNPNFSTARQYYSEFLSIMGRQEEARDQIEEGLLLDPHSFVIRYTSGELYFSQGQFKEALEEMDICLKISKDHPWPLHYSAMINYAMGNNQTSLEFLKRYGLSTGVFSPDGVDSVFRDSNVKEAFRWAINESNRNEQPSRYNLYRIMEWSAMIGDDEKVLDMAEGAFDRKQLYPEFTFEYPFKHLKDHPRYVALLKKMGVS